MFTAKPVYLILALLALTWAGPAAAQDQEPPALREDPRITRSLTAVAAGAMIVENCPQIEPRQVVILFKALELKRYALGLGHSEERIDWFLRNKAQKDRINSLAQTYLEARGLDPDDADSYCRVGRQEIAEDTLTGQLLREK